MKRWLGVTALVGLLAGMTAAESATIYVGKSSVKTNCLGLSFGGNVWKYLQLQFDVMKFLNKDAVLTTSQPNQSRGDFLGASFNLALQLPIHLLPYLDKFEALQPYILTGMGVGLESLETAYFNAPNMSGKKGFLTKLRLFNAFGVGFVFWIIPQMGFKVEYRSIRLKELTDMGFPGRTFSRISFGVCF